MNCGLLDENHVFDPITHFPFLALYTTSAALSVKYWCGLVYIGISRKLGASHKDAKGCLWRQYHTTRGMTKHRYLKTLKCERAGYKMFTPLTEGGSALPISLHNEM